MLGRTIPCITGQWTPRAESFHTLGMCGRRASAKWARLFAALWFAAGILLPVPAVGQTAPSPQRGSSEHSSTESSAPKLVVTVTDETGIAVGLARVLVQGPAQE